LRHNSTPETIYQKACFRAGFFLLKPNKITMKKTHQIKINGTEITLKFGFGLLRLLGEKWGCTGPVDTINHFGKAVGALVGQLADLNITDVATAEAVMQSLPATANLDIPFEILNVLTDVVVAAAQAQKGTVVPESDDVTEWMLENPQEMTEIITLFMQSMPQQRPEEEKKPAGTESPETTAP
jgi:hypothetical protein